MKWVLDQLRANPARTKISVEPTDGVYQNESPESKVYGATASGQIFGLANEVARAVQKEFPGKMVSLYAYSNHSDPPSFVLEPNVFVQLTDGFNYSEKGYSFKELLPLWGKKTRNLGIYSYLTVWQGVEGFDRLPGAPVNRWAAQMRRYIASNAVIVSAERSSDWGPRGLGYYIVGKVLWNPAADVDKLLQDFYDKAFGPAAPAMKRYYQRIDGEKAQMSRNLVGAAMNDLDEAARLAKDRPDVQVRLDDLKSYLVFVSLRAQFDALPATDKTGLKDAALKMFTHVYRTRYSYYGALSSDGNLLLGHFGKRTG